jgi:DNA-binding CsgD family transcriptional regulator
MLTKLLIGEVRMNELQVAFEKVVSSQYYQAMKKLSAPLENFLGINHFWYYRISNQGNYSFIGSHTAWSEFCIDQNMVFSFECLRHPSILGQGISLMKSAEMEYQNVLQTAWEKFNINFNLNIISKTSEGLEAFGFGSRYNDPKSDERVINQLPLLKVFIKTFKENYKNLFLLLEENQVDISSKFGPRFYESNKEIFSIGSREDFLHGMGYGGLLSLTRREKEILKLVAEGYPASYIAEELSLSPRTVENYIARIKDKLLCNSKIELIQKAKDAISEV